MHLIILFLAGINVIGRTGCLYQAFIVASKIIIKPLVPPKLSAIGNEIKDTQTDSLVASSVKRDCATYFQDMNESVGQRSQVGRPKHLQFTINSTCYPRVSCVWMLSYILQVPFNVPSTYHKIQIFYMMWVTPPELTRSILWFRLSITFRI